MPALKRILLVEDSARDAELILDALATHQLANEMVHVRVTRVQRADPALRPLLPGK